MVSTFEEFVSLPMAEQAVWMNELAATPVNQRSPETRLRLQQFEADLARIAATPRGMLPPKLQEYHEMAIRLTQAYRNKTPFDMAKAKREYYEDLDAYLAQCPPIQSMQREIKALLRNNNESMLFFVPALLNEPLLHGAVSRRLR